MDATPSVLYKGHRGHYQLERGWVVWRRLSVPVVIHSVVMSGCSGQADDLVPGGESDAHQAPVFLYPEEVTVRAEMQ